jgi:hypothetical protein
MPPMLLLKMYVLTPIVSLVSFQPMHLL